MNTIKQQLIVLIVAILLVPLLSGMVTKSALAEDKDKSSTQPAATRSDTPFNPWGDGRFDKGKPVKGRENQPFNPWGDDRYDPKPKTPYVSPGLVLPGFDVKYPGAIDSTSDNNRNNRSNRNSRVNQRYRSNRDDQDNQSYYKGDPNNTKYGYVQTDRERHDNYSSRPNYKPGQYRYWGFNSGDPNYCRSTYYYYGNYPYMNRTRIQVVPYSTVNYYSSNITINNNNYYLADRGRSSLDSTLSDIRNAWLNGRSDLIANHVSINQIIAVLLDGSYNYSLDTGDYTQMTYDAIDATKTIAFTWRNVKQRTNGDYTAFGQHVYLDSYGNEQSVYVSYTLRQIGNDYIIVEVGSSKQPLG